SHRRHCDGGIFNAGYFVHVRFLQGQTKTCANVTMIRMAPNSSVAATTSPASSIVARIITDPPGLLFHGDGRRLCKAKPKCQDWTGAGSLRLSRAGLR